MLLNNLLLKIETGQELTESHEKRLAKYLMLVPSIFRLFIYVVFSVMAILLIYVGIIGGYDPISAELAYIVAAVLIVLMILMMVLPRFLRIKKYLETVEKFYQTKFANYEQFDLYYIDQHVSPHIRPLSTPKIYLLTDGYHYLFISDPFKDTIYQMPRIFSSNKNPAYLRVINKEVYEDSQIMVRLEDIENFYITNKNLPSATAIKETKQQNYINYFFDQTPRYDSKSIVVLKLKSGVILRLSNEIYQVFKDLMPHKETTNVF